MRQIALIAVALLGLCGSGHADPAGEALLRATIAAIDADPAWMAASRSITSSGRDTIVSGLAIRRDEPGTALTIATITLTDLSAREGGGFEASALAIDGLELGASNFDLELPAASLQHVAFPGLLDDVFDPARLFTFMARAYRHMADAEMESLTIPALLLKQALASPGDPDLTVTTTYSDLSLTGLRAGVVERVTIGAIAMAGSGRDGPVNVRAGRAEATRLDFGTLGRLFDPAPSTPPDPAWHRIGERIEYRDIAIAGPDGGRVEIAQVTLAGFDMRQPAQPIAADMDRLVAAGMSGDEEEALAKRLLPNLMQAFRYGSLSMEGLAVAGPDNSGGGALERLAVSDISADGIAGIEIRGLTGHGDGGALSVGRIRLNGLGFPDYAALMETIGMAETAGEEARAATAMRMLEHIPTLDEVSLEDIAITANGKTMSLGRALRTVTARVASIPIGASTTIEDLVVPVDIAGAGNPGAGQLKALGYERIALDLVLRTAWADDEGLLRLTWNIDVADAGKIGVAFALSGFSESQIIGLVERAVALGDDPSPAEAIGLLDGMGLHSVEIEVSDNSLVDRVVDQLATQQASTGVLMRMQLQAALAPVFGMLGDGDLQADAARATAAFLRGGHRLVVSASPVVPVPLVAVMATAAASPNALAGLLRAEISAVPVE